MTKPGLTRAIPMGIIGFLLGMIIVLALRALQNMDPVWDPGVALVLAPFMAAFFFIWGLGAFDPRMSVHGEHHEEHEEEIEESGSPFGILLGITWQIATVSLLVILVLFLFALLDTGLRLDTVGRADGSVAQFGNESIIPGIESGASQLVIFIGFVIFTILSLLAFAGLLGIMFYRLSEGVKQVEGEPSPEDLTPPKPVQQIGKIFDFLIRILRGIPSLLGQKG